jgi:hypothetical protein
MDGVFCRRVTSGTDLATGFTFCGWWEVRGRGVPACGHGLFCRVMPAWLARRGLGEVVGTPRFHSAGAVLLVRGRGRFDPPGQRGGPKVPAGLPQSVPSASC